MSKRLMSVSVMNLTILGCGTVSWQTSRACSCYHVSAGQTELLLDCGSGAMKRFEDAGVDYLGLDGVLLSHTEHPDHVTDFCMLMFSLNYTVRGQGFFERRTPLAVLGPAGTRSFYEHLTRIHPAIRPKHFALDIAECGDHTRTVGEVTVTVHQVSHGHTPAVGYRLEHQGTVLAYSGDTGPCDAVVELFKDADLGIMECSIDADRVQVTDHLDARDVGELANRAGLRRLLITHQYPGTDQAMVEKQIREHYAGPFTVARDLDCYEV